MSKPVAIIVILTLAIMTYKYVEGYDLEKMGYKFPPAPPMPKRVEELVAKHHDLNILRTELWGDVWIECLKAGHNPEGCHLVADRILREFDERFK